MHSLFALQFEPKQTFYILDRHPISVRLRSESLHRQHDGITARQCDDGLSHRVPILALRGHTHSVREVDERMNVLDDTTSGGTEHSKEEPMVYGLVLIQHCLTDIEPSQWVIDHVEYQCFADKEIEQSIDRVLDAIRKVIGLLMETALEIEV